jgi:histidinol dehydrogenase
MRSFGTSDKDFETAFAAFLAEPRGNEDTVRDAVAAIIATVRRDGDAALIAYTKRFDRFNLTAEQLRITPDETDAAAASIPRDLHEALALAARRIEFFHRKQVPADLEIQDDAGARLGMRWTPLDAAGIYVPGGKAAYPSSVLMNAIPARVAGVARIAMCVPTPDGVLNPLVLAAAKLAGITEIYRIGGAQAVAALALGTESVAAVDRITGPGNAYVAEAKRQVFGRVGIDSIAGPSEVLIIADAANDPAHVALDLLAQAEHDEAAQSILVTDDASFAQNTRQAVETLLAALPRAAIAAASWRDHGAVILVRNWQEAAAIANRIAPEHLQIMLDDPYEMFTNIRHAGAVFMGRNCPTAIGDYVAGPNHVLPTSGTARFASGLSVYDFLKRTSYVSLSDEALAAIGTAAIRLAGAEGLDAHARSVAARGVTNLDLGANPAHVTVKLPNKI